jgi:AhpD family alkylhydroperoxidase
VHIQACPFPAIEGVADDQQADHDAARAAGADSGPVRVTGSPRRGAAQGLAGRVYEQVEREFGVLAPSLALFSPAPQVLAASWLMLRETLLVTRKVDRAAKEAVATTVSLGNTCPWCVTVHSTMVSGLAGAPVLADRPAEAIADPRLRAVATWARDCGTEEGALLHERHVPPRRRRN